MGEKKKGALPGPGKVVPRPPFPPTSGALDDQKVSPDKAGKWEEEKKGGPWGQPPCGSPRVEVGPKAKPARGIDGGDDLGFQSTGAPIATLDFGGAHVFLGLKGFGGSFRAALS